MVLIDIIKLLIKAPIPGSRNIGAKILQKKNLATNAFSSHAIIFGNFFQFLIYIYYIII